MTDFSLSVIRIIQSAIQLEVVARLAALWADYWLALRAPSALVSENWTIKKRRLSIMKSKDNDRRRRFHRKLSFNVRKNTPERLCPIRCMGHLLQAVFVHDRELLLLAQSVEEGNKNAIKPKIVHVPIVQGATRRQSALTKVRGQNNIAIAPTFLCIADTCTAVQHHLRSITSWICVTVIEMLLGRANQVDQMPPQTHQ